MGDESRNKDVLGFRGKLGVALPSTNTVVAPDFYMHLPPGVTLHTSRILIRIKEIPSHRDDFEKVLFQVIEDTRGAVESLATARPNLMILAIMAECCFWGRKGHDELLEKFRGWSDQIDVMTGAQAMLLALQAFDARKIAFVTPYFEYGNDAIKGFLTDYQIEVSYMHGFSCVSPWAIAEVEEDTVYEYLSRCAEHDVDAIVTVGTNLATVRAARRLEQEWKRPIIPCNLAMVWAGLRALGIKEARPELGLLFEK